jgi:hypothetical protein
MQTYLDKSAETPLTAQYGEIDYRSSRRIFGDQLQDYEAPLVVGNACELEQIVDEPIVTVVLVDIAVIPRHRLFCLSLLEM